VSCYTRFILRKSGTLVTKINTVWLHGLEQYALKSRAVQNSEPDALSVAGVIG
jgi:hypothetical protein